MTLNKLAAEISKILTEHPELGNKTIAINPRISDSAELEIAEYDEDNEQWKRGKLIATFEVEKNNY